MNLESALAERSESKCELCGATDTLQVYEVPQSPESASELDKNILLCATCVDNINNESSDSNHWRCLNESMWTPVPGVQVMAWRILDSIKEHGWPQDLLEMLYLEDDVKAWAEAGSSEDEADVEPTLDSNGAILNTGDTVTLIKDLVVKGANFTAKRGTAVRGISLVQDNAAHIEGKVEGQRIVILTEFVKKR